MSLNLNHKKLAVWEKSISLIKEIYLITKNFPREEQFGIINQLRRASVSITSNIAEGASRTSKLERKRFYQIARSSLVEIDTQLEISKRINYINIDECKLVNKLMNEVFALLTAMINNTK